ncbi:MAG: sulfur carrier protein ThiS [Chloroflexi bacterium]|nr:MAG: sulfur carrier protein ThiS [Chloroflexota bacterium]
MIGLQVNGKPVQLDGPTPLLTYLEALEVNPRAVAVERNGAILEKGEYASTILGDGDVVEIVRMVGGGLAANESGRGPAFHESQPLLRRARPRARLRTR